MKIFGLSSICFITIMVGCAPVGPDYVRPKVEMPTHWAEAKQKPQTNPALDQTTWWKAFEDPVLNRLIEQAVKTNLDIAQARARIVQARAALVIAGAAAMPFVNAAGSVTRNDSSENTASFSISQDTVYKTGFDASWEMDIFGSIRRRREAARARLEADEEDLRSTLLTLLGDVAGNYVELRKNQEQLAITRRHVETQHQILKVTAERYSLGLISYLDVAQAEAQKAATESNIPTLKIAIKKSIHRLGILIGKNPDALMTELSVVSSLPKRQGVAAIGLPSELVSRRPDLRRTERQIAAASADIGVATAELYPKFDLTFGLGLEGANSSNFLQASSRYWSLVPGVSLPIFNGGKNRANIEAKRAVYEETLARYRAAFNGAMEDVENALTAYYAEQERYQLLVESVRSNEEAMTLAKARYRKGLTSFLDVLESQRSLYNAQKDVTQSDANLLTHLIALYKALGGGWNATPT